jgi:uncharacterized membrane protein YecN with MAPEG domain
MLHLCAGWKHTYQGREREIEMKMGLIMDVDRYLLQSRVHIAGALLGLVRVCNLIRLACTRSIFMFDTHTLYISLLLASLYVSFMSYALHQQ